MDKHHRISNIHKDLQNIEDHHYYIHLSFLPSFTLRDSPNYITAQNVNNILVLQYNLTPLLYYALNSVVGCQILTHSPRSVPTQRVLVLYLTPDNRLLLPSLTTIQSKSRKRSKGPFTTLSRLREHGLERSGRICRSMDFIAHRGWRK